MPGPGGYHHEYSNTPYSLAKPEKVYPSEREGYSYPGVMTPEDMEKNRGTFPGEKKPSIKT